MKNKFLTSDFPLAVALLTQGFNISELDRSNPQRVNFCFSDNNRLQSTVNAYWNGQLQVSAKDFYINQRLLKSRMKQNDYVT